MHLVIIALLIQLMVTTFALWLAMKLTKEDDPFLGLLVAAFIASLVELLPITLPAFRQKYNKTAA